jgi:hypothetical protein
MSDVQSFGDNMKSFAFVLVGCTAAGTMAGVMNEMLDNSDERNGLTPPRVRVTPDIGARAGAGFAIIMMAYSLGTQFVAAYRERE